MITSVPKSIFVNADPVAVFAVLADLKNRHQIIGTVTGIELLTPSPVQTGSVIRESRKGLLTRPRKLCIEVFHPPQTIAFSRRAFGFRMQITLRLEEKAGGTKVTMEVSGHAILLPALAASFLVKRWAGEMEKDLEDMRRYVEPRANPTWRPGISKNSTPTATQ